MSARRNCRGKIGFLSESIFIYKNKFDFSDIESSLANNTNFDYRYSPQQKIPILSNGNTLSVDAGGNLVDNTYEWYRNNALVATIVGDNTYTAWTVLRTLITSRFLTSGSHPYHPIR